MWEQNNNTQKYTRYYGIRKKILQNDIQENIICLCRLKLLPVAIHIMAETEHGNQQQLQGDNSSKNSAGVMSQKLKQAYQEKELLLQEVMQLKDQVSFQTSQIFCNRVLFTLWLKLAMFTIFSFVCVYILILII